MPKDKPPTLVIVEWEDGEGRRQWSVGWWINRWIAHDKTMIIAAHKEITNNLECVTTIIQEIPVGDVIDWSTVRDDPSLKDAR